MPELNGLWVLVREERSGLMWVDVRKEAQRVPLAQAKASQSAAASASSMSSYLGLAKIALLVLGVIAVMFLMLRAGGSSQEEIALGSYSDDYEFESIARKPQPRQLQIAEFSNPITPEVLDYIDKQPGDVAKLLRIWMTSREVR